MNKRNEEIKKYHEEAYHCLRPLAFALTKARIEKWVILAPYGKFTWELDTEYFEKYPDDYPKEE